MLLRAGYLVANAAWCITDESGTEIIGIGPTNQMLFESKKSLLDALHQCKLTLKGNVVVLQE